MHFWQCSKRQSLKWRDTQQHVAHFDGFSVSIGSRVLCSWAFGSLFHTTWGLLGKEVLEQKNTPHHIIMDILYFPEVYSYNSLLVPSHSAFPCPFGTVNCFPARNHGTYQKTVKTPWHWITYEGVNLPSPPLSHPSSSEQEQYKLLIYTNPHNSQAYPISTTSYKVKM